MAGTGIADEGVDGSAQGEALPPDVLAGLRAAVLGDGLADDALVARLQELVPELGALAAEAADGTPYSRRLLHLDDEVEVMLARWRPGARCAPHDHGGSAGFVTALTGTYDEGRFDWRGGALVELHRFERPAGQAFAFAAPIVHDMVAPEGGLTLHVYAPPPTRMSVYDVSAQEVLDLVGDFGAWIHEGDHPRRSFAEAAAAAEATAIAPPDDAPEAGTDRSPAAAEVIWVAHTTEYRGGSAEFAVAAATMVRELAVAHPEADVELHPIFAKAEFAAEMARLAAEGRTIAQLHFIGHGGMYGPMFHTTDWPEQFSPHEWRQLEIPFAPGATAHFHTCRSARWFAPFFARTFGVPAFGNQNYTTVSARPDQFSWAGRNPARRDQLYLVAVPGRKSHGWAGSLRKYAGVPVEPMTESRPAEPDGETSYDKVAELYDRAYVDITVREAEWAWVTEHARRARAQLGRPLRVLEVGCGNGALLRALDDRGDLESGLGFDDSTAMVARARARSEDRERLSFARIDGPVIGAPDDSVDVVLSFLSFRYLDWDPIMAEIRRVLAPGGRLWVVDMVERPVGWRELPLLARSTRTHRRMPKRHPRFAVDLPRLTEHPDWKTMVRHNPIRAEHEYRWFLESRFPDHKLEILTVTTRQRVVAFDSGPLEKGANVPLSYP